jgi:hypothetical protein
VPGEPSADITHDDPRKPLRIKHKGM